MLGFIISNLCRWFARALSAMILCYVMVDLIGSGIPNLFSMTGPEALQMGCFAMTLAGFTILWKRERLGGVLASVGIALFYFVNFAVSGRFPSGWVLPLFFLPGAAALISSFIPRSDPRS